MSFNVIFGQVRWSIVPRYDASVEWVFLNLEVECDGKFNFPSVDLRVLCLGKSEVYLS